MRDLLQGTLLVAVLCGSIAPGSAPMLARYGCAAHPRLTAAAVAGPRCGQMLLLLTVAAWDRQPSDCV
jgi:hypothetical protein